MTSFPLYTRYPQLAASLPRLPLSQGPSPVAELAQLGGKTVWIKNDGLYGTVYGGNKPRKLEFILPDIRRTGARTIVTFGALGTHHGLATALYGREHDLRTVLLLIDQPVNDAIRRQLCWLHQAGAILHYTATARRTRLLAPLILLRYTDWRRRKLPYLLQPGASTPLATLGYVNAALELAEQVAAKELPEPETIVVALGSGGTAAGLLLGLRLAGLNSRLLAVLVSDVLPLSPATVARLANATAELMRRRGADLSLTKIEPAAITVLTDWLGDGYGHTTPEAERAQALLQESEGLALDLTYTAKTMASLLALLEDGRLGKGPTLYWHTYNALPQPLPQPEPDDYRRLPQAFHRFFETEV
ncbi:MAG: pyridoxal-phosphate dependent enzyme [Dehalococcoidia bacterium]|nr:MAG: pyridoxal-phosphate dependent enzyme [Dehalococcoidia bacterium]